jgi:hypothetical protein
VIFSASTGSFGSIAASTTRRPFAINSEILPNAPLGIEFDGHGISFTIASVSSVPKRSGCTATTTVWDASAGAGAACACCFACLFSHILAMNTASSPKTTANPIMTRVLARTAVVLFDVELRFLLDRR